MIVHFIFYQHFEKTQDRIIENAPEEKDGSLAFLELLAAQ